MNFLCFKDFFKILDPSHLFSEFKLEQFSVWSFIPVLQVLYQYRINSIKRWSIWTHTIVRLIKRNIKTILAFYDKFSVFLFISNFYLKEKWREIFTNLSIFNPTQILMGGEGVQRPEVTYLDQACRIKPVRWTHFPAWQQGLAGRTCPAAIKKFLS